MKRELAQQHAQSTARPWITAQESALVRETWRSIALDDQAAAVFYATLFELDPALRRYFPEDMTAQKQKLMATLEHAVCCLDRFDVLIEEVSALGKRHSGYGAQAGHYSTVGDALLHMLGRGLGDAWTREAERAWEKTFTALSQTMLRAAASEDAP